MQMTSTVPPVTPSKCGKVWANPNRVPANISMRLFGPGVMEPTNIMTIRGETMINIWLKRVHRIIGRVLRPYQPRRLDNRYSNR